MRFPPICSTPCRVDENILRSSNFENFGGVVFEHIRNATSAALKSLSDIRHSSPCRAFSAGYTEFYDTLQVLSPGLVDQIHSLPKFTECSLQNKINEQFRPIKEYTWEKQGETIAFIALMLGPSLIALINGYRRLKTGNQTFENKIESRIMVGMGGFFSTVIISYLALVTLAIYNGP